MSSYHSSGIPPGYLEAICERFEVVDSADGTKRGGAGRGLATCKAIVIAHGGDITVHSEVGMGSAFSVTLPLKSPALVEVV